MDNVLEPYTDAALIGARTRAALIAENAIRTSADVGEVITDLLAPSQVEVGRRWQAQECTVGEEHLATYVTESVLSSMAVGLEPEPTRGTLVMACAEGEWHGLPARMASELLVLDGWRVVHLGPATPAAHLAAYLAGVDAEAVGISVTMAANLPQAVRSIEAAQRQGVPVVVGGRAFGTRPERARAIGADAFVADARDLHDIAEVAFDERTSPDLAEMEMLVARQVHVVRDAIDWLTRRSGLSGDHHDFWIERVVAHLEDAMSVVEAAVVCDDPTIIADELTWHEGVVSDDRVESEMALVAFESLTAVMPGHSDQATALLQRSMR